MTARFGLNKAPLLRNTAMAIVLSLGMAAALPASAQTQSMSAANSGMSVSVINGFTPQPRQAAIARFIPQAQTSRTRLDYSLLDEALDNSVLKLGMSTRRYMGRPNAATGTRFVTGHRSPYRLEGSRVSFSFLNEEYRGALREYREDLERIGTQIDLTNMSRNEQLAYWFNLHNVALITEIAENYPVRRPSNLKIDGVNLHDAKILTVKGVPLSLRDIRERIVYANWNNPDVIYGFFYGDIGSPGLEYNAFSGPNVGTMLNAQAKEFVNSLRGFNETSRAREVSRLYAEAQPYFFPNWETDLDRHLNRHANTEVKAELASGKPFKVDMYDDVIADLMGGDRPRIATGPVQDLDGNFTSEIALPPEVRRLLQEFQNKREVLRRRGLLQSGGIVIIEDIDTSGQQYDPNIDPASEAYVPRSGSGN